jgi:hypothetical protein
MSNFIDNFYAELMRAHNVDRVEHAAPMRSRRRRRFVKERLGRRSVGAVILASALLVGGAAIAATIQTPPPSNTPPGAGEPRAVLPDASAQTALGILQRPAASTDGIPPTDRVGFSGHSGANPDLARKANGLNGSSAWVVPGRGSICLIADSTITTLTSAGCNPDSSALAGELMLQSTATELPGVDYVAGLVPDGVKQVALELTDKQTVIVPVHENVYAEEIHGYVNNGYMITVSGRTKIGP